MKVLPMFTFLAAFAIGCQVTADEPIIELQRSTDGMKTWETVRIHEGMITVDRKLAVGSLGEGTVFFRLNISMVEPTGMALIPTGPFAMGDNFMEGYPYERPVHTVTLSAYYIGRTEVSKAQWDEVAGWAQDHGYDIGPSDGVGLAPDHPVIVSWYECVKYANAKSELEGLRPVYTVDGGAVFRTGTSTPDIDYQARGYRLPTEAEWECAARGGLTGMRFPFGNSITHSKANYSASTLYFYDVSPTLGHHPDSDDDWPYTTPVGSFAPNAFGLYDMTGNLWEWCADWFSSDYYSSSPATDPTGPESGDERVLRGGYAGSGAGWVRVAKRISSPPGHQSNVYAYGFRLARTGW